MLEIVEGEAVGSTGVPRLGFLREVLVSVGWPGGRKPDLFSGAVAWVD